MKHFAFVMIVMALAAMAGAQESPATRPVPTAPPEPEGMVRIFNGKDLDGWEGHPGLWSVRDGAIRGETTPQNVAKGNTFLIWKGGTVADFELRLSFRIEKGNSGIQYRSKQVPSNNPDNKWVVAGYQAEVENTPGKVGFLYHEKGRGYLCNVGEKVVVDEGGKKQVVGTLGDKAAIGATYRKGDWNDYVIIAKGNHLQHFLNGIQTIDLVDNDPKGRAMEGIVALQIHAGPPMWVEFRDIRLKQYPKAE